MDLLISSPTRPRLLPDPRDTYLYPGRPYYSKRSRTKKMAKRRTNEERRSDKFFLNFIICYKLLCYLKKNFQKNLRYILDI